MHTRDYVTKRGRRADYVAKQGRRASIKNGEGIREGGGREQEEMREIVKWQEHVLIIVEASHCLLAESDFGATCYVHHDPNCYGS